MTSSRNAIERNFFKGIAGEITPPQYGFSSELRRHGANLADHKTHTMTDFAKALVDFKQDIQILDAPDDFVEERFTIDMPSIKCPKCAKEVRHGDELIEHLLEVHSRNKTEKVVFKITKTISPAMNAIVKEGLETQARAGTMKKKIENSDHILVLNIASPLCAWLAQHGLKLYFNAPPTTKATWKHKMITYELPDDAEKRTICFVFTWYDRQVNKMKAARKTKMEERRAKQLREKCASLQIDNNEDIFFKKRTPDEDRYLAQALGLPADFTMEQLQKTIHENTVYQPVVKKEVQFTYADTKAEDGHEMTKEERRLISTLSSNYIHVGSRKRSCVPKRFPKLP